MKKIAIYPGSFNPWHKGHSDILRKALNTFEKVIIAPARNQDKVTWEYDLSVLEKHESGIDHSRIEVVPFTGLLVDFVEDIMIKTHADVSAVIRGLRNGHDLQYEMNNQYWNEDLGLTVPIVYFISDRKYSHISSSAIRALKKFVEETEREDLPV